MFAREFPALLDEDRMPVNFRTFQAGVITIMRISALEQLKMARAFRAGQTDVEGMEKFIAEKMGQSGMPIATEEL